MISEIDPSTLAVDLSRQKGKISEYDRNAIEAARIASEAAGGEALLLLSARVDAKTALKDALSRGPKQAYWVK